MASFLVLAGAVSATQIPDRQAPDHLPARVSGTGPGSLTPPMFVTLPGTAVDGQAAHTDAVVELVHEHVVQAGDSLALLAARYGVSEREIARRNGFDDGSGVGHQTAAGNELPATHLTQTGLVIGQHLLILSRHVVPAAIERGVIVNIPQRMLYRFDAGRLVGVWPVAVGRPGWETPVIEFRIINRLQDPVWYVPRSIQAEMRREGKPVQTMVDPGPDNPLGGYWLGIDRPGFGLHSTNEEDTGYRFASYGCVRLHPEDMAVLFPQLRVGDRGAFIYRTVLLARSADGRIWLEANPDAYGLGEESVETVREQARRQALDPTDIDWSRVALVLGERSGVATEISRGSRPADSVQAAGSSGATSVVHRATGAIDARAMVQHRAHAAASAQQPPKAISVREN